MLHAVKTECIITDIYIYMYRYSFVVIILYGLPVTILFVCLKASRKKNHPEKNNLRHRHHHIYTLLLIGTG